jgi:hypothetical protein
VFPGFCTYHDSKLFAPIETRPFSGAPDQCALLSYRALARERFTKMAGIDVNEFIKGADKGRPMEWQLALQQFAAKYGEGLSAALRDLEVAMRSHYEAVVNGDFAAFESAVFEFEQEFPLLCTTGYFPSEDWTGKTIQDLANLKLEAAWLTAVSFISDGCSFVVFTWAKDHSELMKPFVQEMAEIYKGREADALMKFFFTISDNLAVRPSWWGSLENGPRKALESRVMDGVPLARRAGDDILRPKEGEPLVADNRLRRFAFA